MSVGGDDSLNISLFVDAGPAAPAIAQAINMFNGIVKILDDAKAKADEFGDATARMRDSLRDISAISGGAGVSNEFLGKHLQFIRNTGTTATEAHDYLESFLGEAEAYRGKMTEGEFNKLQEYGARFGVAKGGGLSPRGLLFGRVLAMSPQGVTAEQALGEGAEVSRLLAMGSGREDLLTTSLLAAAPSLVAEGGKGAVGSMRNLGILGMGASRLGSERTVKTSLSQFGRVAQGFASPEWATFLKEELGVREGTKVEEAMLPIFDWMSKESGIKIPELKGGKEQIAAQVQAAAEGETREGQELNALLLRRGIKQVELRRAVIGMFMQSGVMRQELLKQGPQAVMTPETAMAQMRHYETETEGGRLRGTEARTLATETEVGLRFERTRRYQREAYQQLLGQGLLGPEEEAANAWQSLIGKRVGYDREKIMINERARVIAEKELGQRIEKEEPGWAANRVSDVATFMPRLAAMAVGMVAPSMGARMARNVAGAGQSIREGVRDIQGTRDFNLNMGVNAAVDANAVGDISQRLVWGPQGEKTVSEYDTLLGKSAEGRKLFADILARARLRPLVNPGGSKKETR